MRPALLLATLGLAGCLSAPTGLDRDGGGGGDDVIDASTDPDAELQHVWPPDGDIDFQAIATGDYAGDTVEDVVAVNVGDTATGVFLLLGGVDLDPGVPGVATTYSEYERIDMLDPPVAALIVDDYIVILDNPTSGGRITVLSGDSLDELGQFDTGGPSAPALARPILKRLGFGMSGSGTLGIINGDDFRIVGVDALEDPTPDVLAVPAPPGGWGSLQNLDLINEGGPTFFAALAMQAYTSPVPMGGAQVWTAERASANVWPSQTFGSLEWENVDDGQLDLIALDTSGAGGATLCAIDPIANSVSGCQSTPFTEDNGFALLYDNVAPGPEDDLVVALPGPIGTRVDVFPALEILGGNPVSSATPVPQTFVGPNARLATADIDAAVGPRMIVQLADDGALTCITIRPEGIERCSD